MKKTALILLLLLAAIVHPEKIFASHAAGGEIVYEWIAGSTYRFFFTLYRDCSGIAEPDTVQLCFTDPCNTNLNFTAQALKVTGQNGTVQPLCPGYKTQCDTTTSITPGFKKWVYSAVVTLPAQCSSWKVGAYIDTRNINVNLDAMYAFYVETMMNNTTPYQGNSSLYFTQWPLPFVTVGVPTVFNNGAVDPNSDSLTTELIMPRTVTGSCTNAPTTTAFASVQTPYPNYFLPQNPIQTYNTFLTNLQTGAMSFTPQLLGAGVVTARVKEYRNGVLIGYVDREMEVQVGSYGSGSAPTFGVSAPGVIQACVGQPVNFCWWARSAAINAKLKSSDDHAVALPGSSVSYQLQGTDSVRGCLGWTPGISSLGLHTLSITVKDSTCNAPGIMTNYSYTVQVNVVGAAFASKDTAICPGNPVQLTAAGASSYTWSVISGTPNSLSCVTCANPVATPSATTVYEVVASGASVCPNNKDTVTVTMLPYNKPAVTISVTPDTNVLQGTMLTFTATPVNCSNPSYQWQRNGKDLPGAKLATFSNANLVDNDVITVKMQCADTCVIDATSNALHMHIGTDVGAIHTNAVAIHPNPNAGEFSVTGYTGTKEIGIEIMNVTGQVIYKQSNIATTNGRIDHKLNISSISNGNYMLRIITGDKVFTQRLTIQR